jgi:cysteinyl-tRNA synthetase
VLKRYDGETLRFFMLRTHYRSPFNFSDANLDDARAALARLYTALQSVPPAEMVRFAKRFRFKAFLLDTWGKDGKTLLDFLPVTAQDF